MRKTFGSPSGWCGKSASMRFRTPAAPTAVERGACVRSPAPTSARAVTPDEPNAAPADRAPSATRHGLQLGRRLFHLANGASTATAYMLLFTHEQVIHIFGTIACIVYVVDRVRI